MLRENKLIFTGSNISWFGILSWDLRFFSFKINVQEVPTEGFQREMKHPVKDSLRPPQ